ncbi:MAG: PilZ domain-containing protein [Deltaproteobacteria bacterium]|nr:PilZ domain-containing protein [Deltaproteobacteria bacterium]
MSEPNDKPNKRRFPRLSVSVKIEGHWWDLEGGRRKLNALMTVISEGGVQLRCADLIPANARVEFAVKVGTLRRFDARGVVRWWRRTGEVRDLGVEFEEPIQRLGTFVEKELASQGTKVG